MASPAMLSALCASTLAPLAGLAWDPAAFTVVTGMVSSLGGNMLSGFFAEAYQRTREKGQVGGTTAPGRAGLEEELAGQIERVLAAGDDNARALSVEIAGLLRRVDAYGVMLKDGQAALLRDVVRAIEDLAARFPDMDLLRQELALAAREVQAAISASDTGIRAALDTQGATLQAMAEQSALWKVDLRLFLEDLTNSTTRIEWLISSGMASPSATGRRPGFPGCPYQGLLPYTQENAQVFYGRERLTAELMQKVAGHLTRGGPIIVTGASGAGKSSLVRAGLMPMLRKGVQLPGSDRWPQPVVITPTRDPLTEVAAHVAIRIGRSTGDVREELARQPDQAHLAVWQVLLKDDLQRENVAIPGVPGSAQAPGGGTARLVVVVDQFEQLFTLESSPEDRQAFITALHAMSSNPVGPDGGPPALVVIVARGDYIGQCAAYPELARVLDSAQFIVGPMNDSERRLAITGPADTAGLTIEPGLIETVISDLHAIGRGAAGELPLLSQAMLLTWQQREGDRLTSRGYGLFGGISTAVQASAEQAYGALEPEGKAIAQQALCAMVVLDRDGRASRRPLRRKEVYGRVTGSPEMIDAVLERFVAKRLIVLGEDATEISHDSLLREWPRLSEWLERDRDTWILHGQLADAAAKWEEKQDSSYLYRGVQLAVALSEAKTWRTDPARYPVATTGQERFLADSERDATRAERRRRRRTRILATVTALAVLAAVGLAAATTYAFRQRTAANGARDQAVLNQTSAEAQAIAATDTPLAADLNVAGYRMAPGNSLMSDSIAERLISTENAPLPVSLDGGTGAVYGLGLSQDGHLLVTAGVNDAIRLWDVSGPGHALLESSIKPAFSRLDSAVLSKDGRLLAVGSTGAAGFALYNLSDPARPAFLGTFATDIVVAGLALSPNGRLLAVGDTTGAVHLWNVADPAHPAQAGVPGTGSEIGGTRLGLVRALAFSPNGTELASGGEDGTIRLWSLANAASPRLLSQRPGSGAQARVADSESGTGATAVDSVSFSPSGQVLASTDVNDTIDLWNVADPARPQLLGQPSPPDGDEVFTSTFRPDGQVLATAGYDGAVRLWDIADPAHPKQLGQPLAAGTGTVYSIAFGPGGTTLASGAQDGTVHLWSLPRTLLTGPASPVTAVAISADQRFMATAEAGGNVRLWDVTSPASPTALGQPLTIGGGTSEAESVAISPNGRVLAATDYAGSVQLWNISVPARPVPLDGGANLGAVFNKVIAAAGGRTAGTPDPLYSVAFSPDGKTLAVGDAFGLIVLINVADPAHPVPLALGVPADAGHDSVQQMTFSPDGTLLAVSYASGNVELWNASSPVDDTLTGSFFSSGISVASSLAFARNGRALAVGNADGSLQEWDVANAKDPHLLTTFVSGDGVAISPVGSVAVSPDGQWVAAGRDNGTVSVWNLDAASAAPEWTLTTDTSRVNTLAFGQGSVLATGSDDETVQLWNLDVDHAISRVCSLAGGDLTPALWATYIPQVPYKSPCP